MIKEDEKIMEHTILIGLGGEGGKIVEIVAEKMRENAVERGENFSAGDNRTAFVVIDKDEFYNERFGRSDEVKAVSLSSFKKVKEVLSLYSYMGIDDWLPKSIAFDEESLIYLRMAARLRFMEMAEDHRIDELTNILCDVIGKAGVLRNVKVIIVSSLAGCTGSGIFIQTALWIRRFFEARGIESTIKGIFLLPDIFISSLLDLRTSSSERDYLYSNTYAAVRELCALTKIKNRQFEPPVPVKLDNFFDSENPDMDGKPIFDNIFLIDNETETGATLSGMKEYEKSVAQMIYMQINPPMKAGSFSKENGFLNFFRRSDKLLFGSYGVSRAVYPKNSVLAYCALRALKDNLSSDWLKIDRQIECLKKQENEIDEKEEFVRIFDYEIEKALNQKNFSNLFAVIRNDINKSKVISEDGRPFTEYVDKTQDFMDALEKMLHEAFHDKYRNTLSSLDISSIIDTIDDEETALEIVENFDMNLRNMFRRASTEVAGMANCMVVNSIFCEDMCEVNAEDEVSIYGFLNFRNADGKNNFVHPLSARYLLYKLFIVLKKRMENINLDVARKEALKGYSGEKNPVDFDYYGTKREKEETPEEYLIARKSLFQSRKSFIIDFCNRYREYNKNQLYFLKKYCIELLEWNVYRMIMERIELLAHKMEEFFGKLDTVVESIDRNIEKNIESTSGVQGNTVYICASRDNKEKIYQEIKDNIENNFIYMNNAVVKNIYGCFCAEQEPLCRDNKAYQDISLDSFMLWAVKDYMDELTKKGGEQADMDIYEALVRQKDEEMNCYKGKKIDFFPEDDVFDYALYDEEMRKLFGQLNYLASPFLKNNVPPDFEDGVVQGKKYRRFWGLNKDVAYRYRVFGEISDNCFGQNMAYDKNELCCCCEFYGITAEDIPKFNETEESSYFRSYCNNLKEIELRLLQGQEAVLLESPHLDKRWHIILPYITAERQKKEDMKFYRNFWLAIAYNHIGINENGEFVVKKAVINYSGYSENAGDNQVSYMEHIVYDGKAVNMNEIGKLLKALMSDLKFSLEVSLGVKEYLGMDMKLCRQDYGKLILLRGYERRNYNDDSICTEGGLASKGFMNAVSVIARYDSQTGKSDYVTELLAESLGTLVRDVISHGFSESEKDKLEMETYRICMKIFSASSEESKKGMRVFREWAEKAGE